MKDSFFVITPDEDGGCSIEELTREQLEKHLNTEEDGEYVDTAFAEELPGSDPDYWQSKSVIIQGRIVVPQETRVVIKKELP